MKFKSLLSEGFFGDLLDKGLEKLRGYDRGTRIKKTKENFHNLGSDITELFEKNGFKLVLVEPGELFFLPYDVLLYANKSNNRLISVTDYRNEFFIRCFDRNSLSKVSVKVKCDDSDIVSSIDSVCKERYDSLNREPEKFRDHNYLRVAQTMDWCEGPEVQRLLANRSLLEQIKVITGNTIPKFVPEESVEKAIKNGLSLGQLYLFVLTRALGYLSEKDCLSIASKYNV